MDLSHWTKEQLSLSEVSESAALLQQHEGGSVCHRSPLGPPFPPNRPKQTFTNCPLVFELDFGDDTATGTETTPGPAFVTDSSKPPLSACTSMMARKAAALSNASGTLSPVCKAQHDTPLQATAMLARDGGVHHTTPQHLHGLTSNVQHSSDGKIQSRISRQGGVVEDTADTSAHSQASPKQARTDILGDNDGVQCLMVFDEDPPPAATPDVPVFSSMTTTAALQHEAVSAQHCNSHVETFCSEPQMLGKAMQRSLVFDEDAPSHATPVMPFLSSSPNTAGLHLGAVAAEQQQDTGHQYLDKCSSHMGIVNSEPQILEADGIAQQDCTQNGQASTSQPVQQPCQLAIEVDGSSNTCTMVFCDSDSQQKDTPADCQMYWDEEDDQQQAELSVPHHTLSGLDCSLRALCQNPSEAITT